MFVLRVSVKVVLGLVLGLGARKVNVDFSVNAVCSVIRLGFVVGMGLGL